MQTATATNGRERTIHHRLTPARNPAPAALSAPVPAPPDADALREIGANRGLRLVRSRRRKPRPGGLRQARPDRRRRPEAPRLRRRRRSDRHRRGGGRVPAPRRDIDLDRFDRATSIRPREREAEKPAPDAVESLAGKGGRAATRAASRTAAPKARAKQAAPPASAEKPAAASSTAAKAPSRPARLPSPPQAEKQLTPPNPSLSSGRRPRPTQRRSSTCCAWSAAAPPPLTFPRTSPPASAPRSRLSSPTWTGSSAASPGTSCPCSTSHPSPALPRSLWQRSGAGPASTAPKSKRCERWRRGRRGRREHRRGDQRPGDKGAAAVLPGGGDAGERGRVS
jgi:hypothetical protein